MNTNPANPKEINQMMKSKFHFFLVLLATCATHQIFNSKLETYIKPYINTDALQMRWELGK